MQLRIAVGHHRGDAPNLLTLNQTTFDIMGDLTFGESLNMLDGSDYNPWVAAMFAGLHYGTYLHCIRYYPTLEKALLRLVPKSIMKKKQLHDEFSHLRVDRRLEKEDARPDIWGLVLERDKEHGLTREEMYANSNIFMLAGTETTATLLSGLTYYLLTNPEKLTRLTSEIREAFTNDSEITIEKLQTLKYLNARVEEGLRMYPPVANGLPRIVPWGGTMIDGRHVPAGVRLECERRRWHRSLKLTIAQTIVFVTNLAAYRNPNNFREPYSFIPERWLSKNEEFAADKKHALQPFSTGPRVCLGKK